jgi:CSLREA domain-containing protein
MKPLLVEGPILALSSLASMMIIAYAGRSPERSEIRGPSFDAIISAACRCARAGGLLQIKVAYLHFIQLLLDYRGRCERMIRPSFGRSSAHRRITMMNKQSGSRRSTSARTKRARAVLSSLAFLAVGALLPVAAHAATFVVNSTADVVDAAPGNGVCATAGNVCTLRAAIQEANALAGAPHTIVLPAGTYTLTIPGRNEGAAATGDLNITAGLIISGAGAAITVIDANRVDRVLDVLGGSVTISGVTIRGGEADYVPSTGGDGIRNNSILTLNDSAVSGNALGIYNRGTMTLNNSNVSGNDGGNGPGGIYNDGGGTLTLNNSTVSGNRAGGIAGIRSSFWGTVVLNNSTVSGNTAWHNMAGGIYYSCDGASGGGLTLNNSTVSGNSAVSWGGGIVINSVGNSACTVTLNNSTVSGNSAGTGGGIAQDPRYAVPATIRLKNSIVAGNTGSHSANCFGTMTSLGHNIAGDASCALSGVGDRNGIDPLLGPLASNGGPTQTHVPLAGSPAIDAVPLADCKDASGATLATDQRGGARPAGASCDIGSVEAKPQVWILVLGLAGGHGDSIATAPKLFATQADCGAAGQAWLAKVDTLPAIDPWDSKWPAKFLCFQTPNN